MISIELNVVSLRAQIKKKKTTDLKLFKIVKVKIKCTLTLYS